MGKFFDPPNRFPFLSFPLQFLLLISAFATVLALYYSLEQAFCTDDEKRKYATKLGLDKPAGEHGEENEELLEEQNIHMEEITSDLTSVDLQEVTTDRGQEAEVDLTYTCTVPVVCVRVEEGDDEEVVEDDYVSDGGDD